MITNWIILFTFAKVLLKVGKYLIGENKI